MKIILELANFLNHVSEQLSEHSDFHYNPNKLRYILRGAYTENPDQSYKATQSFRKLCFRWVMKLWKSHFQILLASSKNENGTIDYNKFDSLVNYQSSPARAATAEDHAPRMSQPKGKFLAFFHPEPNWLFWNGLNFEIFDENVKRHSIIRRCRL